MVKTKSILLKKVPIDIYKSLILDKADSGKTMEETIIKILKREYERRRNSKPIH